MIRLTRLNHSLFILNAELIEEIQTTPDTMITLSSGRKFVVLESPDDVVRRVIEYRRQVGRTQTATPISAVDTRLPQGAN
jgi:flagellar protein FlbD